MKTLLHRQLGCSHGARLCVLPDSLTKTGRVAVLHNGALRALKAKYACFSNFQIKIILIASFGICTEKTEKMKADRQ